MIRNTLNEIYFGKTKDIVNGLRTITPESETKQQKAMINALTEQLQKRQDKTSN